MTGIQMTRTALFMSGRDAAFYFFKNILWIYYRL